ncbi:MAG: hypothetical protein FWF76_01055 [Oscillospiraceae bacterium]|nr:hypothetical protein [Oscillospiraceae bacterium]
MGALQGILQANANLPVTRTVNEQANQRNTLGREVASTENNVNTGVTQVSGASAAVNTENTVSEMFSYLNNGLDMHDGADVASASVWGSGTFETGGVASPTGQNAEAALDPLSAARGEIAMRADVIATEMAYDQARGLDVTPSLEAMVNLGENADILDANIALEMNGNPNPNPNATSAAEFAPDYNAEPVETIVEMMNEIATAPNTAVVAASVEESDSPSFAVPGAFEGSVAEQVAQAATAPEDGEMSIAAQIASDLQANYSATGNDVLAAG